MPYMISYMNLQFSKRVDLFILAGWSLLSLWLCLYLIIPYWVTIILFFGIPSFYLSFRLPEEVVKIATFSLFLVPVGIIVNYYAHTSGSWTVLQSIFTDKFLNVFVYDDFLWGYLFYYYVLIFYEYFFEKDSIKFRKTQHLAWKMFYVFLCALFIFLAFVGFIKSNYHFPYFYLIFGLVFMIGVPALILFKYPRLIPKLLLLNLYFFFVFLFYEIAALKLGVWGFFGKEFIGWVSVLGYTFPLEEFIFWIVLGASSLVVLYEFFDDDRR